MTESSSPGAVLGLGGGRDISLSALWATMTVLGEEVRLQGRTFKRLSSAIEELLEEIRDPSRDRQDRENPMGAELSAIRSELSRLRSELVDAGPAHADSHLDILLDLRDRLDRGHEVTRTRLEAADRPFSMVERLIGPGAGRHRELLDGLRALEHGYSMVLERLVESLSRQGIVRTADAGLMFDPATMRVVDVETGGREPPGTVVRVLSHGYVLGERCLRLAEVCVARETAAPLIQTGSSRNFSSPVSRLPPEHHDSLPPFRRSIQTWRPLDRVPSVLGRRRETRDQSVFHDAPQGHHSVPPRDLLVLFVAVADREAKLSGALPRAWRDPVNCPRS